MVPEKLKGIFYQVCWDQAKDWQLGTSGYKTAQARLSVIGIKI